MKIIPTTSEAGLRYKVIKKTFLGRRVLCEGGLMILENDRTGIIVFPVLYFSSVSEAVKEITKQFGETANIQQWEGA